ncbi:MAG: MFS transporter [Myxococcota bacterium]
MADSGFVAGLSVLRHRNVACLFLAYLVTHTGTAMAPIAMAFGLLEMTGSTRASGLVVAAPTAAGVVVLLLGGAIADRTSRKRVIVFAESLAMAAQLSIAGLLLTDTATIPLLTLLMLVNGTAMAFNAPASSGLIVQIVDREELQAANALLGMARNSAVAVGATLGGLLVAFVGAGWTLAIDGLSFGASALLVASMRPRAQRTAPSASMIDDLRQGAREFFSHTWLWVIVAQFSLLVAVQESTFGLLGPAVARNTLGGATAWGSIAGLAGVGTLIGGLISLRVRPRYPMRTGTLLTFTFAMIPLALSVPLPTHWIGAIAFVQGITGSIFGVLWYTTVQKKVPEEMLSRVGAYDHLGSIALAPIAVVVTGILFEEIGARSTMLLCAAAVLAPSLAAFAVHDVRHMTTDE